jgi:hypothetical protein
MAPGSEAVERTGPGVSPCPASGAWEKRKGEPHPSRDGAPPWGSFAASAYCASACWLARRLAHSAFMST